MVSLTREDRPMPDNSPSGNLFDALAEEFVERHRRGEQPSLSEYADRYPELADAIRDRFPGLLGTVVCPRTDATGSFAAGLGEAAGNLPLPPAAPSRGGPSRLGDYRILREVGRGGMGVVYEAEQVSLGRHVALKVLPAHGLLNPTFLERFRREAKAAAKLHHTNIVPVFGVGEADGVHFYAMQFIHGQGLDQVLADLRRLRNGPGLDQDQSAATRTASRFGVSEGLLSGLFDAATVRREGVGEPQAASNSLVRPGAPSEVAGAASTASSSTLSAGAAGSEYHLRVARLGLQAAEALAYAHRQGVLHRDIKPSNLLLDRQGIVWITDFGLAKAEGADELTQTGDLVGTLRFMAPERFDGRSLPQSDVYSLGLTLYELLTLRPAFAEGNKGRLIERVLHEPPAPPRRIDPGIPRDLETVVLKCLAKDPEARYATADALAEDLRRFASDRPIKARRSSSAERLVRWCRRNPAVAILSAAILLLLTATAVGGVWVSLRLNKALGQEQKARLEGKRKLFESYVSEADAKRMTGRPGQRFGTLKLIRQALEVGREIGLGEEDRRRLRNIAIAALCLPDVERGLPWPGADDPIPDDFDPDYRRKLEGDRWLRRLPGPAHWLGDSCYSPDGRFLVVATRVWEAGQRPFPIRLWRLDGPKPVLVREWPDGFYGPPGIPACCFRADSRQVAVARADGAVSFHEPASGRELRRTKRTPGKSLALYHPRLPRLAIVRGNEVSLQDAETGKELRRLAHPELLTGAAWHPGGHRLATACGRHIHLWDTGTATAVTEPWRGHLTAGVILAFSPAGDRVLSNDWSNVLRLWDAGTGRLLLSLPGYSGIPVFASDGRSLSGGLRLAAGREMRRLHRPTPGGPEPFINFSLHPDDRLLAGSTKSGLSFFDLDSGEQIGFVAEALSRDVGFAQGNWSRNLSFDRTGALWTTGGGLVRWPVESRAGGRLRIGSPEAIAPLELDGYDGFSTSADGRVAAAPLYDLGARVVHTRRGGDEPARRVVRVGPQPDVRWVFVSPDGRWVVTGSHHRYTTARYKVWDADNGRLVANLPHPEIGECHGFSPDGRWLYVSGKENQRLEVASLVKGPLLEDGPADGAGIDVRRGGWLSERARVGGAFSPDNRFAAFGREDGSIQVVLAEKDEEAARLYSPEVGRIFPSRFSKDGALLLAVGEESKDLYVFDLSLIRAGLAELGVEWDQPAGAGEWRERERRATPLAVEVIDASRSTRRGAMLEVEMRRAVGRLFFNPFDPEAHYLLGVDLLEGGNAERSRAHLGAALAFRPGLDAALFPRAMAGYRLGLWKEARGDFTSHLARYPEDAEAYHYRGHVHERLLDPASAVADFTRVLVRQPKNAHLLDHRGENLLLLGRHDEALADCTGSLGINPEQARPHRNLAWIHAAGPAKWRDPRKALPHALRAVALGGMDSRYRHCLGVVYYRLGRWKEAVKEFEAALAIRGGKSTAYYDYFLAMCHARLGALPRAREHLARAVQWAQEHQKEVLPAQAEEMKAFRAEAEAALKER
jgi:serine/threonine protein kinase/WD40 repeat protein/tetratricopeptide (TPR) repeat protein